MIDLWITDPGGVPMFVPTPLTAYSKCLEVDANLEQVLANSGTPGDRCSLYNNYNNGQPSNNTTIKITLKYSNIPVQQFYHFIDATTGISIPYPKSFCVSKTSTCPAPSPRNNYRPYSKISFEYDPSTKRYKLDTLLVALNYNESPSNYRVKEDYFSVSSQGGRYDERGKFVEDTSLSRIFDPKIGNKSDLNIFEKFLHKLKLFFHSISLFFVTCFLWLKSSL